MLYVLVPGEVFIAGSFRILRNFGPTFHRTDGEFHFFYHIVVDIHNNYFAASPFRNIFKQPKNKIKPQI